MSVNGFVIIFAALAANVLVDGFKVLVVFPAPAYSHYSLGISLAKELAHRGNDVTFITPFPLKTPVENLKEISVAPIVTELQRRRKDLFKLDATTPLGMIEFYTTMTGAITEMTLQQPEVQKLLNSGAAFDVVVVQQLLNEAMMGFGYHFKAPVVLVCPMGSSFWASHLFENPAPTSYVPNLFTKFSDRMSFFDRLQNTFYEIAIRIYRELIAIPQQNTILKKYFPNAPHIKEIMYNASIVLLNSHVSITGPRPHFPNLIEIGGFHVEKPKKLPDKLQEFMDNAKEGVVVFAMGSNLQISMLPDEKRDAILKAFSKLKEKVLWKWEVDVLPGQPSNVKIEKWLPQQDVLAHPNVRAFISHGGLLSTIEAIYHGVPFIGIPILGDQKTNVATAVSNGYGVSVPFQELTEEKLSWALNEILNNPKYRETVRRRSKIMHDQPVKQMDSAMYWIEYVIRHKGATHFRSTSLDLKWYQLSLLDIIVFLTAVTILLFLVFYYIIHKLLGKKREVEVNPKKKKN